MFQLLTSRVGNKILLLGAETSTTGKSAVEPEVHSSRLAQLVERKTLNLVVEGSSPSVGIPPALVAQLVEHGSNKPRVGGSSPSWSIYRSYSVMVITKDSDSFNPGSSPGRTSHRG